MNKLLSIILRVYLRIKRFITRQELNFHQVRFLDRLRLSGKFVRLNGTFNVSGKFGIALGNNVHIENGAFFRAAGGLIIGDNAHVSRNVSIYTTNHDYQKQVLPYDSRMIYKPVIIEKNVWVGRGVSIVPGVQIGEGSIIGMGSTVVKDVPKFSIVGGNPAKGIKNRDVTAYQAAELKKIYGGASGALLAKSEVLAFRRTINDLADDVFFVLGTGRSGSESISRILSSVPRVTCLHEPFVPLIPWVADYQHQLMTREDLKKKLLSIYDHLGFIDQKIERYGESDQKLSFIVPILAELFPKAKFIWLIRDAKKFVASSYARGWYDDWELGRSQIRGGHYDSTIRNNAIHSANRIDGAKAGVLSVEAWETMSVFERNCWYWSYCNQTIQDDLAKIDQDRSLMIRLEDLSARSTLHRIQEFLEFPGTIPERVRKTFNQANYQTYQPSEWTESEWSSFHRWCGPLMDKFY